MAHLGREFIKRNLELEGLVNDPGRISFREYPRVAEGMQSFFESAEHTLIGDTVKLQLNLDRNKKACSAKDTPFRLPNGLQLTYGEINALAGDLYAGQQPITETEENRAERFEEAWKTLAVNKRAVWEAKELLKFLTKEVTETGRPLQPNEKVSDIYKNLPDVSGDLDRITSTRPPSIPRYLEINMMPWDHFGQDARGAYDTGHKAAIAHARCHSGDHDGLLHAYAMNAFADHFLADYFSAGHLRTPRRVLHDKNNLFKDLCAKAMHDEDCAYGLSVEDPKGVSWIMYGDKKYRDPENTSNKNRCCSALQTSADEIYDAWVGKPPSARFQAWDYAPTLESAHKQSAAPLFRVCGKDVERRKVIEDRTLHEFTRDWDPEKTYTEHLEYMKKSGLL